jgi:hypothetical protein
VTRRPQGTCNLQGRDRDSCVRAAALPENCDACTTSACGACRKLYIDFCVNPIPTSDVETCLRERADTATAPGHSDADTRGRCRKGLKQLCEEQVCERTSYRSLTSRVRSSTFGVIFFFFFLRFRPLVPPKLNPQLARLWRKPLANPLLKRPLAPLKQNPQLAKLWRKPLANPLLKRPLAPLKQNPQLAKLWRKPLANPLWKRPLVPLKLNPQRVKRCDCFVMLCICFDCVIRRPRPQLRRKPQRPHRVTPSAKPRRPPLCKWLRYQAFKSLFSPFVNDF